MNAYVVAPSCDAAGTQDDCLPIIEKSQGGRMIDEMIKLLEKAKQVVFTGAPGTGKTYLARQIAQKMILGKIVDDESKLTLEEKTEQLQIVESAGQSTCAFYVMRA